MAPPTVLVSVETLQPYVADIFAKAGCDQAEARRIAFHLVSANLAGHDSHGVIRVPRYVQWLGQGLVKAGRSPSIVSETATHAVLDGNYGFGQTIGPITVDLGIEKARAAGLAVVALRNSGHIGRIGDWAERAAEAGLVSIHFVNVGMGEIVAPFGGTQRRFGTNPMCIGVPQPGGPPLLLDFATSIVAEGKVLVASNGGKPIPHDALVTREGRLSSDPADFYGPLEGVIRDPGRGTGALRAFGDHKGSAIAFMCEILAGCLAGSPTAGPVPGGKRGGIVNGMLSIYLDPNHFGAAHFAETARAFAEYVRSTTPMNPGGEVLVPGDAEARTRADRMRVGIPLQTGTWAGIQATGDALGLTRPGVTLTPLLEQLVNGSMMGTIYVLVALGMVLIYGVMGVLNFAQGVVLTAGAYACLLVFTRVVDSYFLAILLSMLGLAVGGLALERLVFRRLRGNVQMQIVASLGLILVIENGLIAAFGASGLQMRVPPAQILVRAGPLTFTMQHVLILGVVAITVIGLMLFLHRTRLGTALRATSQNPEAARVVGIDPDRVFMITFALACALAALGGALLGPLFLIYPQMGELPLLKALAAIVLGGMASVPGAIVGGLAIGVVEAVSTLFIATDYRDIVVFALLIGGLLLRPQGLFGVRVRGDA